MRKAISVVAGVVVVVGVAWTAGAWYTGQRLEDVVRQRVDESNARLQTLFPGGRAALSLDRLDRHLFSTDVLLRLHVRTGGGPQGQPAAPEDVIEIASHVGHGPFPLERLKHGELMPVMAAGAFGLQENDTVRPWFQLTKGIPPVSGRAVVGYTQAVFGTVRVEPVQMVRDDAALDFSGLMLDFAQDPDKRTRLDGAIDKLSFKMTREPASAQADVDGVTLASDMRPGPADLQVGSTTLTIKRLNLAPAGHAPIALTGYTQRTEASDDNGALALHAAYDIAMLNVAGKDIGTVQVSLGAKRLAPEALKSLVTLYGRLWSRGMEQAQADGTGKTPPSEPALTPEEQALALSARSALLAGNPNFYIDPIVLKTPRGEARFTLNLDLGDPGSADRPIDDRIAQALRKLDARASLAQPLLAGLLSDNMQRDGMDAAAADAQSQALAAVIGKAAAGSGYATVQGSDIVSTLHYADKVVDLNGNKMPLDQFAGMVLQGVMGMMAQPGQDMEAPDQDEPDEDEPDSENQDQAPVPGTTQR
jgi:uncharacterized protein YdgA (DUF945 family)